MFTSLGVVDLFKENSTLKNFLEVACTQDIGSYELCFDGIIFSVAGFDSEEIEPQFSHILFGHCPARISLKNIYHLGQIGNRNKFADYDYGTIKNIEVYGTTDPPEFDLGKVTAKTALFVGENDFLATIEDVDTLNSQLPNVVKYLLLPRKEFNHMDFVWGKHMPETLYPYVFEILEKFS
ncbi:lipase 1-like [Galleria mellonella]|uniref:Lipase 1-like n=1 Tax=Galleria mellonella TaxID=7137 RepID=A0A6J1WGT4_GALME|nr:lipase 1-like [Galleria mellonella]